jgi:serine phosphatase RsbU (regulator of sigma subunit)
MIGDRRILRRSELAMPSAIRLLEETTPHKLPGVLVELAEVAAGCRVALYVLDIGGSELRLVSGDDGWPRDIPLVQSLGHELVRGRMGDLQRLVDEQLEGAAAVPLWLHGRAVGVLLCAERPHQDLELLAREGAAAIELVDRYTDVLHRARRRQSTSPCAEIQENLLPPRVALLEEAELAAAIIPAYDVGGDWYDYAQNPECAWLAVADAAGKGPSSAGSSTVALGAFRAARRSGADLAGAARSIDLAVSELADVTFVTAVLAQWYPATRSLEWLRFGHPHPFLLTAAGDVQLLEGSNHLPLGLLLEGTPLQPARLILEPGDRIAFTSDGVCERRTPEGAFLQEDGIRRVLTSVQEPGAVAVASALVNAVIDANPIAPRDDATVLVLAA